MSQLPEDVTVDILCRLPVKDLVRFKAVSPRWRALIESSEFAKLHLNRSIQTRANLGLILRDEHLHAVDFDSLDGTVQAVELHYHPLRCQDYSTKVWGSCNGIICLSNSFDSVVLWNPSTRKYRKLPDSSVELEEKWRYYENRIYGFGYDSVSDDYKVVRIVMLEGMHDDESFHYEAKAYSLKANSWHRVEKFPHYPHLKRTGGVLVKGALHWVVNEEPRIPRISRAGLIVAFDLACEKYRLVPQPEYSDLNFFMNVERLGECLSVVCYYYYCENVHVWVMNGYGVKESWTKLISVNQQSVIRNMQFVRPVGYSKNGEEVLLQTEGTSLLWYDLKRNRGRRVKIRGLQELMQVEMCVGTLVSLDDGGEGNGKKQQEQEDRNMYVNICINWLFLAVDILLLLLYFF